jgi:hypothetical protein
MTDSQKDGVSPFDGRGHRLGIVDVADDDPQSVCVEIALVGELVAVAGKGCDGVTCRQRLVDEQAPGASGGTNDA